MTEIEEQQFLSDVITAAGLVSYGKQCKALGERISKYAYKRMFEITENKTKGTKETKNELP